MARGIWDRLTGKNRNGEAPVIPWMKEKILKHQDSTSIKQIELDGMTIHYKRPYELLHTYKEIFGRDIYNFKADREIPLVIDCGSNIGISVLYFHSIHPKAEIIAFEPDENNFELLNKNINAATIQHCQPHQAAIWTHNGTISFDATESEASHISENKDGKQVKCVRLADILAQHEHVDFLKIDIEGAEYEVMKDCAKLLSHVQNMFLEYHGKTNETYKLNELLQIVRENGFSVYIQNAADTLEQPFVNKTTSGPYDVQLNLFCYKTN